MHQHMPAAVIGDATLYHADCRDVLREMADNSIDAVVSDPPYFLTSIVKRFGKDGAAPAQFGVDGAFKRLSGGFMNQKWDSPDAAPIDPGFAHWMAGFIDGEGCFSVHKKQVNGCETYDCQFSLTLRADDRAIVEVMRDALGGIGSIASRPPKDNAKEQVRFCVSSKADCMRLRAVLSVFPLRAKKARDFEIWCHALDAWVDHAPGSSWEDVSYYRDALMAVRNFGSVHRPERLFFYNIGRELLRVMKPGAHLVMFNGSRTYHHMVCGLEDAGFEVRDTLAWIYGSGFPKSHSMRDIGHPELGTALKPAHEPIVLARKPLIGTVAENVLQWGTGAINVDGCRVATDEGLNGGAYAAGRAPRAMQPGGGSRTAQPGEFRQPAGRWPANIIHDGSDEVVSAFPDAPGRQRTVGPEHGAKLSKGVYGDFGPRDTFTPRIDTDKSAARFFYCAKAGRKDREEGLSADSGRANTHPTVKPTSLMQWLCRLVTPPGGVVLDPFLGSGSTGKAALLEGFRFIGIEREDEYLPIAAARIGWAAGRMDTDEAAPAVATQQPAANDNEPASEPDLFSAAA